MELILVRHTVPDVPKSVCYGQFDVPLAASFHKDAEIIKSKIGEIPNHVYSSPLSRCKKLAEYLTKKPIIFDPRIKEFNFGSWEMKAWNAIDQSALNEWMTHFDTYKVPGGESLPQMNKRVLSFLDDLLNQKIDRALLVTHSGVIRCIYAHILEFPLRNLFKMHVGFNEVTRIEIQKDNTFSRVIDHK